ncbi:hypothetical protein SAMN05216252_12961 [Actinacidiphila glaucinigra]|uniref:Uncharacterized protein n=1 Tax=Actinacidiphila glaucinigra TaxID=235986 RepID=A0A239MZA1_9ACTN|nr:hypothetical protein SAMN05216252_12961 [Actinacidiphila glaucinigra]
MRRLLGMAADMVTRVGGIGAGVTTVSTATEAA